MTRDQSVTTCRLGDAHGDAGHVVLIVDVDPAGLDLAGRRLLARVREAVAAWEVANAADQPNGSGPCGLLGGPSAARDGRSGVPGRGQDRETRRMSRTNAARNGDQDRLDHEIPRLLT